MAPRPRDRAATDAALVAALEYRARASVQHASSLCASALATLGERDPLRRAPAAEAGAARRAHHAPVCALLRTALAAEPTCVAALLLLRALVHDQPALRAPDDPSFEELGWRALHAPPPARNHWRATINIWAAVSIAKSKIQQCGAGTLQGGTPYATTTTAISLHANPYALFLAAYFSDRIDNAYAPAVPLLRAAAAADLEAAENCLGSFHEFGDGLPRSSATAIAHFRRAASRGHVGAQANLGALLVSSTSDDNNAGAAPGALEEGVALLRTAAAQGHGVAHVHLAQLHLTGRGVALDIGAALALLDAARAQRCLDALVVTATLALLGLDARAAVRPRALLREAAALDHAVAMHRLGLAYVGALGRGRPRPHRAAPWLRRAADAGIPDAALRLARLVLDGCGTPRSPAEALVLLVPLAAAAAPAPDGEEEEVEEETATAARELIATKFGDTLPEGLGGRKVTVDSLRAEAVLAVLARPQFADASPDVADNMLELYAEVVVRQSAPVPRAALATVVLPALVRRVSARSACTLSTLARLGLLSLVSAWFCFSASSSCLSLLAVTNKQNNQTRKQHRWCCTRWGRSLRSRAQRSNVRSRPWTITYLHALS